MSATARPESDVLDLAARRSDIEALYARGLLEQAGYQAALERVLPPRAWARWVSGSLLALAPALIAAGIVYFFAFNWARIGPFVKLGAIEAALVACLLVAWRDRLERERGRVCLTVAAVLVGVFMAVFGQVYQTGADAWQLFATWSALIVPWCLLGRSAVLWLLWLTVTSVGLVAWLEQAGVLSRPYELLAVSAVTGLVLAFLAAREALARRAVPWAARRWHRVVPGIVAVVLAACPILVLVIDGRWAEHGTATAAAIGVAAHGWLLYAYRYRHPDMWLVAAATLSLCVCVDLAVYRFIDHRFDETAVHFALAAFTLALFGAAVALLRHAAATMERRHA